MSLIVNHLVKHFGGVKAVNDVSFEIAPGECVALIGPNGAGKSTCFACVAGQHEATSGSISWRGQTLQNSPAARRQALGIGRTFQVAQTFEALTVLQNIQLIRANLRGLSGWRSLDKTAVTDCHALLDTLQLKELAHADVLGLPYGAKKRLELVLALAGVGYRPGKVSSGSGSGSGSGPAADSSKLLLLDEPAAGLAQAERAQLMHLVKSLASQGIAVLYTEHNMDAVFGVADRVLVLIDGEIAAQGSASDVAGNPLVRSRYLGANFSAAAQHA